MRVEPAASMRRKGARALQTFVVIAVALAGCDQLLGPGASHWKVLHVDEIATGQVRAGDAANYRFDAPPGQPLRVFFEGQGDSLLLELADQSADSDRLVAHMVSGGRDTSLNDLASPWFQVDGQHDVRAHVRTLGASGSGSYTLMLYGLDTAPETGSAVVGLGDTVSESIDPPGDRDEFRVHVSGPGQIIAFLQSLGSAYLSMNVQDSATGTLVAQVASAGPVPYLESRSSSLVTVAAGTYIASVAAAPGADARGAYRFQLRPISLQPESVPGVVTPGDTVTGEWIQPLGDVDEYQLDLAQAHDVNVFFWRSTGSGPAFELRLLDGDSAVSPVLRDMWQSSPDSLQTGPLHLHPGNYTIRVSGPTRGDPATSTGEYGFEVRDIGPSTPSASRPMGTGVAAAETGGPHSLSRPWE